MLEPVFLETCVTYQINCSTQQLDLCIKYQTALPKNMGMSHRTCIQRPDICLVRLAAQGNTRCSGSFSNFPFSLEAGSCLRSAQSTVAAAQGGGQLRPSNKAFSLVFSLA